MVANPENWAWDALFKEKKVNYEYGRLQRNYPLVRKGDLVLVIRQRRTRSSRQ